MLLNNKSTGVNKGIMERFFLVLSSRPILWGVIVSWLFLGSYSYAQTDTAMAKPLRPKIEIIARPLKDSILLRWAPNSSLLWESANKYGYTIERITLVRNGLLLASPEHRVLTPIPLRPTPLAGWESAVKADKYAAIAAQALFGETFDVKNKTATDLYSVITKVRERDTRFSFALFAADQSPLVAKLSALWYTDRTVNPTEKYLYRVLIAQNKTKADTGVVYTGTSEFQPLTKPVDLKAEFGDHLVNVSWNQLYFKQIYNAYQLERSDDGGKTYHSISTEPLVTLFAENRPAPDLFYKTDTLPVNGKNYFYRVRGFNAFGELGPPSDSIVGAGHNAITASPFITKKVVLNNQKIAITWEYPVDKNNDIAGFKLARSNKPDKGFKYLAENIAPNLREYIDEKPQLTNYYVISVFNQHGEILRSAPALVMLIDSIPPSPPVKLSGSIDTTGKVTVCWNANREEDIFGYRIYRANYAGEEFSQITVAPVTDTCFIDNVTLKTLTRSVFYRIMAIDQRQNHSELSAPIELKRPDRIPPVSPVFKAVKSTPEGVWLQWINSTSTDVKSHLLYRSMSGTNQWKLIAAFLIGDSVSEYLDKGADSLSYGTYTIMARDMDNNESKPANPVKGKKIDIGIRPGIDKVFSDVDREKNIIQLAWKKPDGNVFRYLVYRAKGNEPMSLFSSVDGNMLLFADTRLRLNTRYQYSIKVVYTDGNQSGFSKPTIINF